MSLATQTLSREWKKEGKEERREGGGNLRFKGN